MLDVISGRYQPPVVYWFRGLGKEKFGPRQVLQQEATDQAKKYSMSTTNAADLDGDGLVDLVIGDTSGKVFWSRNEGSRTAPRFGPRTALRAGAADLGSYHKSDPLPVDWDGDGTLDLLVGDETTDILFFRGLGKLAFAPGISLFTKQAAIPGAGYTKAKQALEPHRVIPGYRLRLHAADWNGDGKLDLLVGNCEEGKKPEGEERGPTTGFVRVLLRR